MMLETKGPVAEVPGIQLRISRPLFVGAESSGAHLSSWPNVAIDGPWRAPPHIMPARESAGLVVARQRRTARSRRERAT